jgi:hypothetical protein
MRWPETKLSWTIVTALVFLGAYLLVFVPAQISGVPVFHDIGIALVALALKSLWDGLRDDFNLPRFQIACSDRPPCQRVIINKEGIRQLHVRLQVTNVGRTPEDACEVRVEKIERLHATVHDQHVFACDHDPRPLKWAGRGTEPIPINTGAFDLVNLGVRRADFLENLHLDFDARGAFELNLADSTIRGFRIGGTVYGKKAKPEPFAFDVSWNSVGDLTPIKIERVC